MADRRVTFLINANIKNFEKNLSKAQRSFRKFGTNLKNIGQNLTRNVTLPIGIAGIASIKLAADFQTSMRKIETLVGIAGDKVNAMTGDVINLSNKTGQSAKGLADAFFVIQSAGQRGAKAMHILERSAKASAIGLGETKEIARTVTAIINAYGKENMSAAKATDQLMSIVREGNLEASALAPTLGRVIGMASQLGIEFSEVGASIATFTRLGVSAEEAVIGLRGIMNTLIGPAGEAEERLGKLEMTFDDLRKMVTEKGLARTLIFLVDKFKGNTEALGDLIPNVRALAAVLGTAGAQGETYIQIAENIARANGLIDEGFNKISEDTAFKFGLALNELKNLGIDLGTMLLPIANSILGWAKNAVTWFGNLSVETKKLGIVIMGLTAALGLAFLALGQIFAIMAAINWQITLVVLAIAVLGAAFIYIWQNWEAIIERISDWSWWKNLIIDMAQFFLKWNPTSLMIKGWNWLVKEIPKVWDKIIGYISDINWWKLMLQKMKQAVFGDNPLGPIMGIVKALTGIDYNIIMNLDRTAAEASIKVLEKSMADMQLQYLTGDAWTIPNPFEAMSEGLESSRDEIKEYEHQFGSLADAIEGFASETKKFLLGLAPSLGAGALLPTTEAPGVPAGPKAPPMMAQYGLKGYKPMTEIILPGTAQVTKDLEKVAGGLKYSEEAAKNLGETLQMILNTAIVDFATTLGNAFTGDAGAAGFFNNILIIVADFMKAFGQALIAAGFASEAFKLLIENPILAIAAGIALIVASTVVRNILKKGPQAQGMQQGGIIPPGFPNDSYLAGLTSGEMVLPEPKALPDYRGDRRLSMSYSMRRFIIEEDRERERMKRG